MGTSANSKDEKKLAWWQLSLVGVGCIIGTGYFLGSVIGIKMAGPAIIISFILAAIGTYIVAEALAKMSAKDPQKGAFRSYAKKAYGSWAGFSSGWVYWFSEILIVGSQLTALSILSKFWFPDWPLWVFGTFYAILGVIVVLIGTSGFEKAQNIFAVIKIAAIFMFIILAIAVIFGLFGGGSSDFQFSKTVGDFIPSGVMGLWASLIFGFYAFGGIEIMGIMSTRLKNREDAVKSASVMLIVLTIIYLISLILATSLASLEKFKINESPFVVALADYNLDFFPHIFIGAIIIAGFSTMSASLFAVTSMIVTLAEDGDAPKLFAIKWKLKVQPFALLLTICGLIASIVLSVLMPGKVYEYITTSAGLMLMYNWLFILFSFPRLIEVKGGGHIKRYIGMLLIAAAISGTLVDKESRPGFYVSILFVILIVIAFIIKHFMNKNKDKETAH
ncbi:amino acid permease [Aciduricibacillus chroicocephali]|uniref:Amino acid permease n=1 Tax=Aciduricibacillus chroicocephali TaxID=3054939 RepID=A0ABY9KWU4_9BACI|nr:amino acid permease [Bacillaceae bacterium 44XB]